MEIEKYLTLKEKKTGCLRNILVPPVLRPLGSITTAATAAEEEKGGEGGTSNRRSLRPRTRNREGERSLQEITTTITTT